MADTQVVREDGSVVRNASIPSTHSAVHNDVMRSWVELREVGSHGGTLERFECDIINEPKVEIQFCIGGSGE